MAIVRVVMVILWEDLRIIMLPRMMTMKIRLFVRRLLLLLEGDGRGIPKP